MVFFFFLTCPHKGKGRVIRTCNFRFIRRGSQPIDLSFGDMFNGFNIDEIDKWGLWVLFGSWKLG